MSTIKLSVIIPVYNVEKHISQCVLSVINQEIQDYEIILIDDGSTDNSPYICDSLEQSYESVSVIHQENKGLSGARNTGIKNAKGEYLLFLDSDDYINEFINLTDITNNLSKDITQYKWIYYYSNTKRFQHFPDYPKLEDLSYFDVLKKLIQMGMFSISACNKIVKRQLIIENSLYFEEGLLSEDIDWSLNLYLYATSIDVLNQEVYIYRQQREGSITMAGGFKSIKSLLYIINKWFYYSYKNESIKNLYFEYLAYQYLILLTVSTKKNSTREMREEMKKYRTLLKYDANYKVKMANSVIKWFGFYVGIKILKLYWFLKKRNIIRM